MQYFGGKSRIAKEIASVLEANRKFGQLYVEPFVGGGSVICKMTGRREAFDKHPYLIAIYNALKSGWTPPDFVSESDYIKAKSLQLEKHEIGFIGFACSFSGKWFGGYARNTRGDNFCLQSKNSLLKKFQAMKDVVFSEADFITLQFNDALIYCDPPYFGTTPYAGCEKFNSLTFWDKVRSWSAHNTVIVSEYSAPEDFKCIWERNTNTEIRNGKNEREQRTEKLFILNK